jgi:hypothetical protein
LPSHVHGALLQPWKNMTVTDETNSTPSESGTTGWRPLSLCGFLLALLLLLLLLLLQCLCLLHRQPLAPATALCCFHVLDCCIVNLQALGACVMEDGKRTAQAWSACVASRSAGKQLSSQAPQLRVVLCRSL